MPYLTSSLYRTNGYVTDRFINDGRIRIPDTFKDVVLKLCPEVSDVVTVGYMELPTTYSPETFDQVKRFLVSVDIHFVSRNGVKKTKVEYQDFLNDYFKMTYVDIDFISISVNKFMFPPEKTNTDKFFELFGK